MGSACSGNKSPDVVVVPPNREPNYAAPARSSTSAASSPAASSSSSNSNSCYTRKSTSNTPPPINTFGMAVHGKFAWVLFGQLGTYDSNAKCFPKNQNVYKLNMQTFTWTTLTKTDISGTWPVARVGATTALLGDHIYLQGGNSGDVLTDLWALDVSIPNALDWISIKAADSPKLQYASASVVGNDIYYFGGGDGKLWLDTMWKYNSISQTFKLLEVKGQKPPGRLQHSATVVNPNKIVIFGGESDNNSQRNDLHIFETDTLQWTTPRLKGRVPRSRVSAQSVYDVERGLLYYFGGFSVGTFSNELFALDMSALEWRDVSNGIDGPDARCRGCLFRYSDKLYLFGGNCSKCSFNDLWELNPAKVELSPVEENTICWPSFELVNQEGAIPVPRNTFASVLVNGLLFTIFGQDGLGSKLVQDIQTFNTKTNAWSSLTSNNTFGVWPEARIGHSACVIDNTIWIHGGNRGKENKNTLLKDTSGLQVKDDGTYEWISVDTTDSNPSRHFHSAVGYKKNMYLFGGGDGTLWLSETWVFKPFAKRWSQLSTTGTRPAGRLQHSCVLVNNKMFVYGGEPSSAEQLDDIHFLDLDTFEWSTPSVSGWKPTKRLSAMGFAFPEQNKLVFFGGYSQKTFMSEVVIFDYNSNTWHEPIIDHSHKPGVRCRYGGAIVDGKIILTGGNNIQKSYNDTWYLDMSFGVKKLTKSKTTVVPKALPAAIPIAVPEAVPEEEPVVVASVPVPVAAAAPAPVAPAANEVDEDAVTMKKPVKPAAAAKPQTIAIAGDDVATLKGKVPSHAAGAGDDAATVKNPGKGAAATAAKAPTAMSLEDFLASLDLSEHLPKFEEQQIGIESVPYLQDSHLKELGLPLGHRMKVLNAIGAAQNSNSGGSTSAGAAPASNFVSEWDVLLRYIGARSPIRSYTCKKMLGAGAFGKVFLVNPVADANQKFVVKSIRCESTEEVNDALNEIKSVGQIRDEAIVQVHNFFFESVASSYYVFIVMDFCEGGELLDKLQGGGLSPADFKKWVTQIAKGLKAVHAQNIIHRDLKPANILLAEGNAKIADFGVARTVQENEMARTYAGSRAYMAPEVLMEQPYTVSADIWGFGCMVWEMMTGQVPKPFTPKAVKAMMEAIPAQYEPMGSAVLQASLQFDESDRMTAAQIYDMCLSFQ